GLAATGGEAAAGTGPAASREGAGGAGGGRAGRADLLLRHPEEPAPAARAVGRAGRGAGAGTAGGGGAAGPGADRARADPGRARAGARLRVPEGGAVPQRARLTCGLPQRRGGQGAGGSGGGGDAGGAGGGRGTGDGRSAGARSRRCGRGDRDRRAAGRQRGWGRGTQRSRGNSLELRTFSEGTGRWKPRARAITALRESHRSYVFRSSNPSKLRSQLSPGHSLPGAPRKASTSSAGSDVPSRDSGDRWSSWRRTTGQRRSRRPATGSSGACLARASAAPSRRFTNDRRASARRW